MMRFVFAALLGLIASSAWAACPQSGSCNIASGRYLAFPPTGWDGKTPLATMMFLHGYSQTPEDYAEPSGWFMQFGALHQVLIVLPEGKEKTWSYIGSPMENRDDTGLLRDVLVDVEARYPVDHKRLWLSGFSQGASMAWYAACALGSRLAAVTPVAGAFWEPLPPTCANGPIPMLHIHGSEDQVVPMEGRAIGEKWRQGDVKKSLAIFETSNGCKPGKSEPGPSLEALDTCTRMPLTCSDGRAMPVILCMHKGGHWLERAYLEAGWTFLQSLQK
jgi:polyhydroxybutyrate depolymerase